MKPTQNATLLARLGRDKAGNTLAIMAAAFVPLAGLIGGGVDMTRIYLTKTRMQQACDAGALAGRKAMAADAWSTSAENRALELFSANFEEGDYGTSALTTSYLEDDGTVSGTASTTVPMTLMRIFGNTESDVNVSCTAKMEIPNTDVMFVLDVTSSMNCAPGCAYAANEQSGAKIKGLRSAVQCFYEALLRVNTAEDCGTNPSATTYSGTAQIRLGFVPYAVNVNVGRLLDTDWFPDSWQYETRRPNFDDVYAWTVASTGTPGNWGDWTGTPNDLTRADRYSNWSSVGNSGSTNINGTSYNNRIALNSTQCGNLNPYNTNNSQRRMIGYVEVSNNLQNPSQTGTPAAPVHPATTQTANYSQSNQVEIRGFRYSYSSSYCYLQRSSNRSYTLTRNGTGTNQISWSGPHKHFRDWTYDRMPLDLTTLKTDLEANRNTPGVPITLTLPGYDVQNGSNVRLSGQTNSTTLRIPADLTVSWDGCIEERRTYRSNSNNPGNDWSTIPDSALDMNVNLVPSTSDPDSQWGPLIRDVFWGRYTGANNNKVNRTTPVTTTSNLDRNLSGNTSAGYYCPNEARKLATYNSPGSLETYMGNLVADSIGTYHDIGMIWGARLLSPVGLFADENAFTAKGGSIERHMIYMTDGDARAYNNNLDAYGSSWWARRQTNYNPSDAQITQLVNARLAAMCTRVKNMNIKLWVISYGGGVSPSDEARLTTCASPGNYYSAEDGDALITKFKQIASEIADLRLTK